MVYCMLLGYGNRQKSHCKIFLNQLPWTFWKFAVFSIAIFYTYTNFRMAFKINMFRILSKFAIFSLSKNMGKGSFTTIIP